MAPSIEPFAPSHAPDVLRVIGAVFSEYGMTFDPPGFDADLLDVQRYYLERGGWFSVLTDAGRVVGTVAAVPHDGGACEIKRVYLLAEYRGQGRGRALMEHVLALVSAAGYREAIAWSDVRFETAHRVYERLGFERIGERVIDDIDRSREYGFRKRLAGEGGRFDSLAPEGGRTR
jgi:putative acetyltransferase